MREKPGRKSAKSAHTMERTHQAASRVTRGLKQSVTSTLWGRAAGRCQFANCNKPLWKSPTTQERVNIAQQAHIYSFSVDGARGHGALTSAQLNNIENLMLVCYDCHRVIDSDLQGAKYSATLLRSWKHSHEARVELVTSIEHDKKSHVILYGANVGCHSSPLSHAATLPILFPRRYPASDRPIELGMVNSSWDDRTPEFWHIEERHLLNQYERHVRPLLANGSTTHLSVFGLAPQPLLILLGAQLTDIPAADVYPLLREPSGWGYATDADDLGFQIIEPTTGGGPPALVLSLSATVTRDRIRAALGEEAAIWELTIARPHNDAIRSEHHLQSLRRALRRLLDAIKARHGQGALLHVFPAASVAAAIDLGRVRAPKADMPWQLYDQINARGGFVRALRID